MTTKIFHNPRCSKSRQTLELMKQQGIETDIIEYLKTPPSAEELKQILRLLGIGPRELIRSKQKEYKELGLDNSDTTDEQLIEAMIANPILIERPIVVHDGKAAIGRPPEKILELF